MSWLILALGLAALLVAAWALTWGLRKAGVMGEVTASNIYARIGGWAVMGALVWLALFFAPVGLYVLVGLMSFLALKEYFSLIHTRLADHRALVWAYLAIPLQAGWIAMGWTMMALLFIPVYLFLFLPVRLMLTGVTEGFIGAAARLHWGLMVFVFCLSHLALLLLLPATPAMPYGGLGLAGTLLILTALNDVAQYCWGKGLSSLWGPHKIVPKISPNKTWEGFLGGLLTTLALGLLLRPISGLGLPLALVTAAVVAIAGFMGDVVMSAVKRDAGVKDSGTLLPGHGGLIDRLDSLCYSAPLFFHVVNFWAYSQAGIHI